MKDNIPNIPFTTITQLTTLDQIKRLDPYVPVMEVRDMLEICGNDGIGLGTLRNKNGLVVGEVTVFDGIAYHTEVSGKTSLLQGNEKVYFAQVGHFEKSLQKHDISASNIGELQNRLVELAPRNSKGAFLVRMEDAKFDKIIFRSVDGSAQFDFNGTTRYPENLKEIVAKQKEITLHNPSLNIKVGGLFCDTSKTGQATPESLPGVHIHGISDNLEYGGHIQIQHLEGINCKAQLMPIGEWKILTKGRESENFRGFEYREALKGAFAGDLGALGYSTNFENNR